MGENVETSSSLPSVFFAYGSSVAILAQWGRSAAADGPPAIYIYIYFFFPGAVFSKPLSYGYCWDCLLLLITYIAVVAVFCILVGYCSGIDC